MGSILEKDGHRIAVSSPERVKAALAQGYTPVGGGIPLVDRAGGRAVSVAPDELDAKLAQGYDIEGLGGTDRRVAQTQKEDTYGTLSEKFRTAGEGALDTVFLGGFSAAQRALGVDPKELEGRRDINPEWRTGGEILGTGLSIAAGAGGGTAGAALRATPAGLAMRGGAAIATRGAGKGLVAKLAAAGAGGAAEGGAFGFGHGVAELAASPEPITGERALSVLSSDVLYGAAAGGAVGLVARGAEIGLGKAKTVVDDYAAKVRRGADVEDDLASMGHKELRVAEKSERTLAKQERDAALERYDFDEAAEVKTLKEQNTAARRELADDIAAARRESKTAKDFIATKGAQEREVREAAKIGLEADKAIDRVLRNPKRLAENPAVAKAALQQTEHAIETTLAQESVIRARVDFDVSGARAAALEVLPARLERVRGLLGKIDELSASPTSQRVAEIQQARQALKETPISSPKLEAIAQAREALAERGAGGGVAESLAQGAAYEGASTIVDMIPLGPFRPIVAPVLRAKMAKTVTDLAFRRLGRASAEQADRIAKAIATVTDTTAKVRRAAPVAATKVLSAVSFGTAAQPLRQPVASKSKLLDAFRARENELANLITTGPDGKPRMQPGARAAMAARLGAVRALSPMLADQMETAGARRAEFLASKMPKRPDIAAIQVGPDRWRPSDFEMAQFARYVAAVEDPASVVERVADGTLTPEDAEALRVVYPEIYQQTRLELMSNLPTIRATLPYNRQIALSIYFEVPVHPSMQPGVIGVLQGGFADEPGTDGGLTAPTPQPAFGSIQKSMPSATPAQQRAG